jgi:DNA-binding NarL/FixJ family response regulator
MLRRPLSTRLDWSICAEASTGRQAIALARQLQPDIAIVNIDIPELGGLDVTRRISTVSPNTRVLIVTRYASEFLSKEVREAGANGYVMNADVNRHLISAVDLVGSGLMSFPDSTPDRSSNLTGFNVCELRRAIPPRGLTPREREVIQLIAAGKSNREVARTLSISVKTVETHRTNVMRKLNIHSSGELIRYAVENDLVES